MTEVDVTTSRPAIGAAASVPAVGAEVDITSPRPAEVDVRSSRPAIGAVVRARSGVDVAVPTGGGAVGPPGPPGPSGGSYVHHQAVPTAVWTIVHGLGYFPNVTVFDTTGDTVEGDVAFPDADTVVLTFSAGFGGTAYLS